MSSQRKVVKTGRSDRYPPFPKVSSNGRISSHTAVRPYRAQAYVGDVDGDPQQA